MSDSVLFFAGCGQVKSGDFETKKERFFNRSGSLIRVKDGSFVSPIWGMCEKGRTVIRYTSVVRPHVVSVFADREESQVFKRIFLLASILILSVNLVAPGAAQQDEDRLQVVASFSILADVVSNVAGDAADVTSLMPLDAGPHGFSPSPRDMVMLAEADVVFVVGANFEEMLLESIVNADTDMNIVVASDCVAIQPFGAEHEHEGEMHEDESHGHGEHGHAGGIAMMCDGHHTEIGGIAPTLPAQVSVLGMLYELDCGGYTHHDEASDEGEHIHAQGSCDGHVWTDPYNVMLWALMARDTLSALDPDNADIYAANTNAYIAELAALFDEVAAMIDTIPEDNRKLVTNHLAYGYYAHRFGLEMVGTVIPGASTLAEPSAGEIAALIDGIEAAGVPAVFADSTANPDLAEQIAHDTGATFHKLYTGSLTGAGGEAPTYIDYILVDTRIIVKALGGTVEGD
jgi:ABC-type Zn uptake system ZnuABC Zn-binding protein ZnuA